MRVRISHSFSVYIHIDMDPYRIDIITPQAVAIFDELGGGSASQSKSPGAWAPYESKIVSQNFERMINDFQRCNFHHSCFCLILLTTCRE